MLTLQRYGLTLPAKRIVCPRCEGTGKHVNPGIDGDGLTGSDFAEMNQADLEDFNDSYLGGVYDVTCEDCDGKNVVLEIDYEALTKEQAEALEIAEIENSASEY